MCQIFQRFYKVSPLKLVIKYLQKDNEGMLSLLSTRSASPPELTDSAWTYLKCIKSSTNRMLQVHLKWDYSWVG